MTILYHHRTRGLGAEGVHILGVKDAFEKLGYQCDMLSFPGADPDINKASSPSKAKISGRFNILKFAANLTRKMPQFVFELCEIAYNLIALPRLSKHCKESKTDFIYERYSLFMFAGALYASLAKKKFVIEVNDSAVVERVRPLKLKRLAKWIENYVFKKADGIVFISTYFRDLATKTYGPHIIAKSSVCPNAANLDHFKPNETSRFNTRQSLGTQDKVVIGYVGAFVHWHGIDWFVHKIAPLLKNHPHITLLLVGDGVAYKEIDRTIKEYDVDSQVILTGRVAHTEVEKYLNAMDIGILPDSNFYGSPMKLFEFMAMGVPMVAPDFSPIAEVVNDGNTSWLFPANDQEACVEKLLKAAMDKKELKRVGENARQYIIEERQWTHNAKSALSLINEIPLFEPGVPQKVI